MAPDLDIRYIVQPGLNPYNILAAVVIIVVVAVYLLLFYLPIKKNWDKYKCNDGMMLLAPLFGKDANLTLKECVNDALDASYNTTIADASIPVSVMTQIKSIVDYINQKMQAVQTALSTKSDTLITPGLRTQLSIISGDKEKIRGINDLNDKIRNNKNKLSETKTRLNRATLAANKAASNVRIYEGEHKKKHNPSYVADRARLTTISITRTKEKDDAQKKLDELNANIKSLTTQVNSIGKLKSSQNKLKTDIKDARLLIK